MFNNLFKLYRTSTLKTPLEDFTTEGLAGILNFCPGLLQAFVKFLDLPGQDYSVETQVYYSESAYPTCFIDMVLKNKDTICFIENKVDASESGSNQLSKYDNLLQSFNIKHKELRYITKWSDPKKGFKTNFKQYRWYDVASLLSKEYIEDLLIKDYYNFLKSHNMALKKEITTDTVIALKNFNQAFQTAKLHLDRAREVLQQEFPNASIVSNNMSSYKSIIQGERICYYIQNLFYSGSDYHTEILIHFKAEDVSYQVQLWMHPKHPNAKIVYNHASQIIGFEKPIWHDEGFIVYNNIKLYHFIDSEDTDGEIMDWFKKSINNIIKLIKNTSYGDDKLDWLPELIADNNHLD